MICTPAEGVKRQGHTKEERGEAANTHDVKGEEKKQKRKDNKYMRKMDQHAHTTHKLATLVKDDPKAPFTIVTTPRCKGGCYSISWIAPIYLIMLSVKQGRISQTIGEQSTQVVGDISGRGGRWRKCVFIHMLIYVGIGACVSREKNNTLTY